MPTFEEILLAEINPGKPVVGLSGFGQKVKNSLDYLNGVLSAVDVTGLSNGSFEVASDAANPDVPDGWVKSLYAGGSGGRDTVSPQHGAACLKFTHPGGAGNGGGYLTSNYVVCSPLAPILLEVAHWATNAAMHNAIHLLFYDAAKLYISTAVAYDTTVNSVSPGLFLVGGVPPASARFVKVRLMGGLTDVNAAGSAYFDAATLSPLFASRARAAIQDFTFAQLTTATNDAWANVGAAQTVILPIGGIGQILTFTALGRGSDEDTGVPEYYNSYARFIVNGAYTSNEVFLPISTTNIGPLTFAVDLPASVVGPISIQAQLYKHVSAEAFIIKSTQDMTCLPNY
ncbi:MAG: hypothetical protein ACSLFH_01730 [Desulfuromonadales bacterium]